MAKKIVFLTLLFGISISGTAQLVYKDVAGIFYNRCTSCHHQNQHAPSMMNYSETFPHKNLINAYLNSGEMPPWPPDTTYTRFIHEHIITASEKSAILSWISTGAQQGDTTQAPPAPVYSSQYKLNGTPDLVVQIPVFTSNATDSTDAYNIFALPTGLTTDRIVRAIEVVPGNYGVVHHVVVNADTNGTSSSNLSGNAFTITGNEGLCGYQPGAEPVVFPGSSILKMGVKLKAGSQIVLQIHYPAGTQGQLDSTQVRLYFYPTGTTGVRPVYITVPLQDWSFSIPADSVKAVTVDAADPISWYFAVSIFSALPHAHKVCSSVLSYAYALSDTIPLLREKKWDFNWQYYYYYKNLVKIPAFYRYHGIHVYDNTASNPNNPFSPPQTISVGTNSNNEMYYDSFQWIVYQPGDEYINVDSLLTHDTLFVNSVKEPEILIPWSYSFIYPNPLTQSATIQIVNSSLKTENYELEIVDVIGRKVKPIIESNTNSFIVHKSHLLKGTYFYRVTSNNKLQSTGKFIVE